jgi:hypothetical protein
MQLLYCDETNFQKVGGDFFVYGGIVIPGDQAAGLAAAVEMIRVTHKVPTDYLFKFNPGPADFSHEQFIALKKAVIESAVQHGCRLLINLLLHDIATSSEEARRMGLNTLAYHFDCYLNRPKQPGLMLIDRFVDKKLDDQLKQKVTVGLTGDLPFSKELKLKRIIGYHLAAIGQSQFCSVVDVLLGSLRFAINAFTQNKQEQLHSAGLILGQMSPLFFREGGLFKDASKVHEISLWFSPKTVKVQKYRDRYLAVKGFLSDHGIDAAQDV